MEDRPAQVRVLLDSLLEQRLQRLLSQVPLQDAETDTLTIEIAGDPAETVRRLTTRFKGPGEGGQRSATAADASAGCGAGRPGNRRAQVMASTTPVGGRFCRVWKFLMAASVPPPKLESMEPAYSFSSLRRC